MPGTDPFTQLQPYLWGFFVVLTFVTMETLLFIFWNVFYTIQKHFRKTFWFFFTYKWHPLRWMSLALTGRASYRERHNRLFIVSFKKLIMYDFDIPDKIHDHRSITYDSRERIYSRIEWACKAKNLLFWVEETPGGVHIWLLSERLNLSVNKDRMRFHYLAKVLNCDPLYRRVCLGKGYSSCRVSPKKRPSIVTEDRIAKYVGLFGDHSLVDKLCLEDFRYYLKYWSKYQNQRDIDQAYSIVNYLESYPDFNY